MIGLSERTLQGMRREYLKTLDATAVAYRSQMSDSPTGRAETFVQLTDSLGQPVGIFPLRIDPMTVDERLRSGMIERGNECWISVPIEVPLLQQGDRIDLMEGGVAIQTYGIKAAQERRSGVAFDRKYRAVRVS